MKNLIFLRSITQFILVAVVSSFVMISPVGATGGGGGGGGGDGADFNSSRPGKPKLTDRELAQTLKPEIDAAGLAVIQAAQIIRSNASLLRISEKIGNDATARRLRAENRAAAQAIVEALTEYLFWVRLANVKPSQAVIVAAGFVATFLGAR